MTEPVKTALYRFYGADKDLLYIGVTNDLGIRWHSHAKKKSWWPEVQHLAADWHPSRREALRAEANAITAEHPRHNVGHNREPSRPRPKRVTHARAKAIFQRGSLMHAEELSAFLRSTGPSLDTYAELGGGPVYIQRGDGRLYDPKDVRAWLAGVESSFAGGKLCRFYSLSRPASVARRDALLANWDAGYARREQEESAA